jgi:hypothetical protein
VVFRRLFEFADVLVLSEYYYLGKDDDKDSARGGMLSSQEVRRGLTWLAREHRVRMHRPSRGRFDARSAARIRRCEYVLFSAERRQR